MQESNPLVSIIVPYYKQAAFIAESVRSAKTQGYPNIEIILVDDGSPDPVEPLLREIGHLQIVRTENAGVSAARNTGFQRSAGEYLIFLDSDDVLMPGAIEAHLKAMRARPEAGLSFGAIRIIDETGREIRPPHICRARKDYFRMLLEGNPIGCPAAAMIRKQAFIDAGFFETSLRNAEDYDLYLRIARQKPLVRLTQCVAEYRQHAGGKSHIKDRQLRTTLAVLDRIQNVLTESERKRLPYARRRWKHTFCHQKTLTHGLWTLYYKVRAMLGISFRSYFMREL